MSATPILASEGAEPSRSTRARIEAAWGGLGLVGRVSTILACAVSLVLATAIGTGYATAAGLALSVLGVAAMVDLAEHRLPNALVGMATVPVAVAGAAAYIRDDPAFGSALAGSLLLAGPLLLAHLISPAGMGFGDVKAAAVTGGAIGLVDDDLALPALVVALVLVGGWGLIRRRRAVPLGPGLVTGAIVVIAVGQVAGS